MNTFFSKLIDPRPTIAQDMTEEELVLMQRHALHWREWMERGRVVTFGVVADPAGAFGIGVVEVLDDAEVRDLTENDPVVLSGLGFRYEVHPMPFGAVHR